MRRLNLTTLEYRRERNDLIQVFKILKEIDKIDPDKFFTVRQGSGTRGHKFKIEKQRSRLNIQKYFFTNRIVDNLNALPFSVLESDSVETFKTRLENYNLDKFDRYTPSFMV